MTQIYIDGGKKYTEIMPLSAINGRGHIDFFQTWWGREVPGSELHLNSSSHQSCQKNMLVGLNNDPLNTIFSQCDMMTDSFLNPATFEGLLDEVAGYGLWFQRIKAASEGRCGWIRLGFIYFILSWGQVGSFSVTDYGVELRAASVIYRHELPS